MVLLLGIKVKGATPVLTGIGMRPCAFCAFYTAKTFYKSKNDRTNLPLPLSDNVVVAVKPEFEVYVRSVLHFPCCHQMLITFIFNRSFEGNPDLEEFMRQANILSEDLKADGITESDVYLDYLYMLKHENSVNEAIIVKK